MTPREIKTCLRVAPPTLQTEIMEATNHTAQQWYGAVTEQSRLAACQVTAELLLIAGGALEYLRRDPAGCAPLRRPAL